MKWSEFKEIVDKKIKDADFEDIDINYIDISSLGYHGTDIVISTEDDELTIYN